MKIVISGYVSSKKTGIARVLENILREITFIDKENEYLLFHNWDNDSFKLYSNGNPRLKLKKYHIRINSPLLNLLWHLFILPIRLLINRVDLYYTISGNMLMLFKPCPTVVVIHDLIEFNVKSKFSRLRIFYRKISYPVTAKRADRIITVSENSKKDIIRFCKVSPEKIDVIYNGVDPRFHLLDNKEILKILKKYKLPEKYILFVGTIDSPGKNCINLVQAYYKLKRKKGFERKLVLVGKKGFGFEKMVLKIQELSLKDDIFLLGYVPDDDLPAIYNGAEVFAFLSLYEGFGLPIIEAMACGVPVITANTSCFSEIVGDAGILVNPFNIDEIAGSILNVIISKDLKERLRFKGIERAKNFSWTDAAEKTLDVFKKLSKHGSQLTKNNG